MVRCVLHRRERQRPLYFYAPNSHADRSIIDSHRQQEVYHTPQDDFSAPPDNIVLFRKCECSLYTL
jgi:hypothetical protein